MGPEANTKVVVLGVPIDALTMDQMVAHAARVIEQREHMLVGVVNAAKLVNMHRQPKLRAAVTAADVILADGMGVVWAARFLRLPLPERVPGIDLMMRLLALAHERRHRVFCLGATQEVLDEVLAQIRRDYPGVQIAGAHHGYFDEANDQDVAEQIMSAKPDMLFAAMSSPKKEEFLARWSKQMNVPVCHGVGGAFDVMAGKVRRAPHIWQRLGMEWLYRTLQEPRRLWRRYLVTNTLFGWMVLRQWLGARHHAEALH